MRGRRFLVVVLVFTVFSSTGVSAVTTPSPVTNSTAVRTQQTDEQLTFAVTQGSECYEVTPVGHAWENVSAFYDYNGRNSEGTAEFQKNQVSNVILFHGTNGYSLVVLHDRYGDFGNASYGGTATLEFLGLPESGEWVIEDDHYVGHDDVYNHRGTRSKITWKWIGGRSDGAAFRGLGTDDQLELTIRPRFNEDSEGWGSWDWSGDDRNRTAAWRLFTDRDEAVQLDMDQPITITTGSCDSGVPTTALTASSTRVEPNESVTLSANNTTGDSGVVEYQWDLNGDGEVDYTSRDPSVSHRFDSPGTHTVRVTSRDEANRTASSRLNITVLDDSTTAGTATETSGDETTDTDVSQSSGPGFGLLAVGAALILSAVVVIFARR